MMVFRDMTFCREKTCAKFGDGEKDCPRSLTVAVENLAGKWWNIGDKKEDWGPAPISIFIERPDCFVEKKTPT